MDKFSLLIRQEPDKKFENIQVSVHYKDLQIIITYDFQCLPFVENFFIRNLVFISDLGENDKIFFSLTFSPRILHF